MTTMCGNEICNTTFKTAIFCKREIKANAQSSVAVGKMYQEEITIKHRDSKEISILRRRWYGYKVSDNADCSSPSVFLKYDEIMYPINREPKCEETTKSISTTSTQNFQGAGIKGYSRWILLLICIVLGAVAIRSCLLFKNTCINVFDIGSLRDTLNENLFGQDEIKDQLIRTIESMNFSANSDLKFLVFSGSSGVGKTYVASLIAQFFPWSENVQLLMAPIHSELLDSETHIYLSSCGYNLVIIDDLKESDTNMILELMKRYELIYKKEFLKLIFIFIFNTDQKFSSNVTNNSFTAHLKLNNLIMDKSVIHFHFKQLEEDNIMKFIEKSLYKRGIMETQVFISHFFRRFMNPTFLEGGCKRISSKLALFLEMYEQKKLKANLQ